MKTNNTDNWTGCKYYYHVQIDCLLLGVWIDPHDTSYNYIDLDVNAIPETTTILEQTGFTNIASSYYEVGGKDNTFNVSGTFKDFYGKVLQYMQYSPLDNRGLRLVGVLTNDPNKVVVCSVITN